MEQKLKGLSNDKLREIILEMAGLLTQEQVRKLETVIEKYAGRGEKNSGIPSPARMSEEYLKERMEQIEGWMEEIDEGEAYLDTEGYEDYSAGYWGSEWIVEYYDNQGLGGKLESMIQFARECVNDRRYQEADFIYDWLWNMEVQTDEEDGDALDLAMLSQENVIHADMQQLTLLTLYAVYQIRRPEERAEAVYSYFSYSPFHNLHIEDMFYAGRENLGETEQFWQDWISLLKTRNGETAGRLLREALLYHEGVGGLVKAADENFKVHPSLYLAAMTEYDKVHDYGKMEEVGKRALEKIDVGLRIRSEVALKAGYASSNLMHTEEMMQFCWEAFRCDATDKNFLRLFGTQEMAQKYGIRGGEVLPTLVRENTIGYLENPELRRNTITDSEYDTLSFYVGDFESAKAASRNPKGSLGWSTRFIQKGIRLFLLYLYEKPLPSKAAEEIAGVVGFSDKEEAPYAMGFESEIAEESRRLKTSIFWNYFRRWKQYFPMTAEEKASYLSWAERTVHSRAEAIVGGQHRGQYGEVARLLAMLGEVKEDMGIKGARQTIFTEYKKKFPRHSSFQAEMKNYFGTREVFLR